MIRPEMASCSYPSIERTYVIKYLGVVLDFTLSSKAHIDAIGSRLRKLIFVFKNLRHVVRISNYMYPYRHTVWYTWLFVKHY